ncbi:hypothetical protein QBC45DRAFT_397720 [Copromyces sp. CBS 386.78]|nr:hypothetical protein QBC45DRAFT_397720 [Copromyces sp. CBS 386.78]
MPTRNNARSAKSFAAKLVQDCEPKARSKREYELTTALNNFATKYQKLANGIHGEDWHARFVKALEVSTIAMNNISNVNNSVNAANSANVNGTAMVKANGAANANSAALANSTAMVLRSAVNPVNPVNAAHPVVNMKTEDAVTTNFKVDANGPSTVRVHKGTSPSGMPAGTVEFHLSGPATVQVHTGTAPAGSAPAFVHVQPDDGYGDPGKKSPPPDMYR